jgi:signal peptide peptidase SppA
MSDAHRLHHVTDTVLATPWAITPPMLSVIATVLARRIAGRSHDGLWSVPPGPPPRPTTTPVVKGKSLAILPIHGVLSPRINLLSEFSGGASYEELSRELGALVADASVSTIILDLDTPGGSVAGATSLAREILAARAQKPIIAQVAYSACSAGYWLASCATEIVAAPQSNVGSIGVYAMHENLQKALDQEGVAVTFISAGKYKVEGNETGPLSADALAHRQALVDEAYEQFVGDVALGRGLSTAAVKAGYGEGRVLSAAMGLAAGMIDRVNTLDETISRLTQGTPARSLFPAADTPQEPLEATGQDWLQVNQAFAREAEATLLRLTL